MDWIGIDMGYQLIVKEKKPCLFAIGDFDSGQLEEPLPFPIERHPVAKDETDSELAIAKAKEMGYDTIILWGALSGRLDHTLANLRCITWQYPSVMAMDEMHRVCCLLPGKYTMDDQYAHISFFAMEPSIISLIDFDYPLDHRRIDQNDFYACSNSISNAGKTGTVVLYEGRVICVETNCR